MQNAPTKHNKGQRKEKKIRTEKICHKKIIIMECRNIKN